MVENITQPHPDGNKQQNPDKQDPIQLAQPQNISKPHQTPQKTQSSKPTNNTKKEKKEKGKLSSKQTFQQQNTAASQASSFSCKICKNDLLDHEKQFFPCSCKYKICHNCFWHYVHDVDCKCPNCGFRYDVGKVKETMRQLAGPRSYSPEEKLTKSNFMQRPPKIRQQEVKISNKNTKIIQGASQHLADPQIRLESPISVSTRTDKTLPTSHHSLKHNTLQQRKRSLSSKAGTEKSAPVKKDIAQGKKTQKSHGLMNESQNKKSKRISSENQRKQEQMVNARILQKNSLYIIGLSPNVAKEETLKRYEYFGQYGKICSIIINKEKAFKSENQGLCFSAYITYSSEKEASLAILCVDQFVFDGRLLHASYGRTKYCRFFIKSSNCLNHQCPYLHRKANAQDLLSVQDEQNKKALFQKCHQIALKLSQVSEMTEASLRQILREHKENIQRNLKQNHIGRIVMPQIENIFEKKNLYKYCIQPIDSSASAKESMPEKQSSQDVVHPTQQSAQKSEILKTGKKKQSSNKTTHMQSAATATNNTQKSQKFGSDSNSVDFQNTLFQSSGIQKRGRRGRLQSFGTQAEMMDHNSTKGGQTQIFQQLLPQSYLSRRMAQDDNQLARVSGKTGLTLSHRQSMMTHGFSGLAANHSGSNTINNTSHNMMSSARGTAPHPSHQLSQNQMSGANQTLINKQLLFQGGRQVNQTNESQGLAAFQQQPQCFQNQRNPFFNQQIQPSTDSRARSGSQVAGNLPEQVQFDEEYLHQWNYLKRRRNSSHSKFRLFDTQPSQLNLPDSKEEQKRFVEALRQALAEASKANDDLHTKGFEDASIGYFSSIFAGDINRKVFFDDYNMYSEGLAGGRASPIRESILKSSRRGSEDYGVMNRQRSQHSLIVESVARILDDTAFEQKGDREVIFNEPNFKTGPPSEVYPQLRHDEMTLQMNSIFDKKWNNQFEGQSSNSLQNPSGLKFRADQRDQESAQANLTGNVISPIKSTQNQHVNPSVNNLQTINQYSFYNSPFFLIPTHTENTQHMSAAFQENNLRHANPWSNQFSLPGQAHLTSMRGNDTWRLTYNPHPLLPPNQAPLSAQSAVGEANLMAHKPYQIWSESKINPIRPSTSTQKISAADISKPQQATTGTKNQGSEGFAPNSSKPMLQLTSQNLEKLNQEYFPSKDMLYAKIFADFVPSSPHTLRKSDDQKINSFAFSGQPQHPTSMQYITPQSLFCFALDNDDTKALRHTTLKVQKQTSRDDAGVFKAGGLRRGQEFMSASGGFLSSKNEPQKLFNRDSDDDQQDPQVTQEELEIANQLANEASLGFEDMRASLFTKSQLIEQSDHPHTRSRSQRYRNQQSETDKKTATQGLIAGSGNLVKHSSGQSGGPGHQSQYLIKGLNKSVNLVQRNSELHVRRSLMSKGFSPNESSKSSSLQANQQKLQENPHHTTIKRQNSPTQPNQSSLAITLNQQNSNQNINIINNNTNTVDSKAQTEDNDKTPQINFYQEYVKVNRSFRNSCSGLISSGYRVHASEERRRSSYSQGRHSSTKIKSSLICDDVFRRNNRHSFKILPPMRSNLISSPLGLLKYKNHQIDEVNEDGQTVKTKNSKMNEDGKASKNDDSEKLNTNSNSLRMNSTDRLSANHKQQCTARLRDTEASLSRSRERQQQSAAYPYPKSNQQQPL